VACVGGGCEWERALGGGIGGRSGGGGGVGEEQTRRCGGGATGADFTPDSKPKPIKIKVVGGQMTWGFNLC